jgi:phosphohistidine phosphatase
MTLYLVRHGEAERGTDDAARSLTHDGRAEVETVARVVAATGVTVGRILQSGRRRASQTAEIWAAALTPSPPIVEAPGLDPMADPRDVRSLLETASGESWMIVGHLPHLGRLTSLLATGGSEEEIVRLPTGGVVALEQEDGVWRIRWLLTPGLARAVASRPEEK